MIRKVLLALVLIVVVFATFVAFQPSDFTITRTATMAAPPSAVFAQIDDFHRWAAWSPWDKLDPAMKKTFEGPPAGTGAIYSWAGNKQAGVGRMTLTESRPDELVRIKLEFMAPFQATDTSEFNLKPTPNGTEVTWSMSGKNGYMFKAMGVFMNMDKMIGGDFEKGLAQMKTIVEGAPKQ